MPDNNPWNSPKIDAERLLERRRVEVPTWLSANAITTLEGYELFLERHGLWSSGPLTEKVKACLGVVVEGAVIAERLPEVSSEGTDLPVSNKVARTKESKKRGLDT